MNEFFIDLTLQQKAFIVSFANHNISQTPFVMLSNVHGLGVPYLISRLKALKPKYNDQPHISIIDSLIERYADLKVKNKLVAKLSKIKDIEIAGASIKFVSFAFNIKDKAKVIKIAGNMPISIHTQDNLTTATIKLK